jgi:hypothetical protein
MRIDASSRMTCQQHQAVSTPVEDQHARHRLDPASILNGAVRL